MSRRRLNDDERALWKVVTRSIAPLRPRPLEGLDDQKTAVPAPVAKTKSSPVLTRSPVFVPPAPKPVVPPVLVPLGRRLKKRIARGSHDIDARLDLHGMTQAEAHDALSGFLRRAHANGASIVLVITGKGRVGDGERGVLKRQVPMWLRLPEFRAMIVGFESASIGHGGEGALYVRLRRARQD